MRARITKDYRAATAANPMPRDYLVGAVVEGEIAHSAVADGHAIEIKDEAPPKRTAPAPRAGRAATPKADATDDDPPAQKIG